VADDPDGVESGSVTPGERGIEAAARKVIAGIEDAELEARYPNRTHFIAADDPRHGEMATRVLFDGDPVALVYPDGREILSLQSKRAGWALCSCC
jgi:hypothetical protein